MVKSRSKTPRPFASWHAVIEAERMSILFSCSPFLLFLGEREPPAEDAERVGIGSLPDDDPFAAVEPGHARIGGPEVGAATEVQQSRGRLVRQVVAPGQEPACGPPAFPLLPGDENLALGV